MDDQLSVDELEKEHRLAKARVWNHSREGRKEEAELAARDVANFERELTLRGIPVR